MHSAEAKIVSKETPRLPQLDGLRAAAILLVLASHHLAAIPIAAVRRVTDMGWIGVDIFFVLSGFLIGGILLDQRTSINYYGVFYFRRFLRIVPLYALLVITGLIVLVSGLQSHFAGHSLAGQPVAGMWLAVFFLQNFGPMLGLDVPRYLGPTWSLAVEEQFYLILPPLVRNLKDRKLLMILGAAIVFAPVLRSVLLLEFGTKVANLCYIFLPCRWDSLLLGVITAYIYRSATWWQWLARHLRQLQMLWGLLALISLGLLFSLDGHLDPRMIVFGYTLLDAFFACTLLLSILNPPGRLGRCLSRPAFRPVATISYGLYLLQSPAMAVTESLCRLAHINYAPVGWEAVGVALASLTITALAAALSWKFFESRLLALGHDKKYRTTRA